MKIFKSLKIFILVILFWTNCAYSQDDYSLSLKASTKDTQQIFKSVIDLLHRAFEPQRTLKLVLILPKLANFEVKHLDQVYIIQGDSHLEVINCVFNSKPELSKIEIYSDQDILIKDKNDSFTSKTIWLNPDELIKSFDRIEYYSLAD